MCLENPVDLPQASVPHFNHPFEAPHYDTVARPIICQPSTKTGDREPVAVRFALRSVIPQMKRVVRSASNPLSLTRRHTRAIKTSCKSRSIHLSDQPTAITRELHASNPIGPAM